MEEKIILVLEHIDTGSSLDMVWQSIPRVANPLAEKVPPHLIVASFLSHIKRPAECLVWIPSPL
jgi:hypothetical protein